MNQSTAPPAAAPHDQRALSPEKTLRNLFLMLFLRGRSSRGLRKQSAPRSVGQKLALTLLFYALFGTLAMTFQHMPIFSLSVYLNSMTFVFLGMFVASSAGEILFNKEEADILMHRPIEPRALLWAKVRVLVEVSLWLSFAFNLVGFFVGMAAPGGGWRFPPVHAISITLEALFCTGVVVMVYQLCLRWFGRERLEGLMTTAQVVIAVGAVLSGQIFPRVAGHLNNVASFRSSWWIALLPPAWFGGIDDALAGSGELASWLLAGIAVAATFSVLWIAFGKLAHDYQAGLQSLNETISKRPKYRAGRHWIDKLVAAPPLRWWLRDPIERASFLLTAAYLVRDRDVKLRIYPGIAPMLVVPFILLLQGTGQAGFGAGGFGLAFAGGYVGLVPLLGLSMLQYSQQWQASDVFRAAPIAGPAPLCHGARRAMLCLLTIPLIFVFGLVAWLTQGDAAQLLLLLPGIIALPVYALIPNLGGAAVPLSVPTDESKSAGRGLSMIAVMMVSMILSGLASWSFSHGWFWLFILIESIVAGSLYVSMRRSIDSAGWPKLA